MDTSWAEIDFVLRDGEPFWAKARGTEFYIKDGKWFRHDTQEFVTDFDLHKGGLYVAFTLNNDDRIVWFEDGYTNIISVTGVISSYSPEGQVSHNYDNTPGV